MSKSIDQLTSSDIIALAQSDHASIPQLQQQEDAWSRAGELARAVGEVLATTTRAHFGDTAGSSLHTLVEESLNSVQALRELGPAVAAHQTSLASAAEEAQRFKDAIDTLSGELDEADQAYREHPEVAFQDFNGAPDGASGYSQYRSAVTEDMRMELRLTSDVYETQARAQQEFQPRRFSGMGEWSGPLPKEMPRDLATGPGEPGYRATPGPEQFGRNVSGASVPSLSGSGQPILQSSGTAVTVSPGNGTFPTPSAPPVTGTPSVPVTGGVPAAGNPRFVGRSPATPPPGRAPVAPGAGRPITGTPGRGSSTGTPSPGPSRHTPSTPIRSSGPSMPGHGARHNSPSRSTTSPGNGTGAPRTTPSHPTTRPTSVSRPTGAAPARPTGTAPQVRPPTGAAPGRPTPPHTGTRPSTGTAPGRTPTIDPSRSHPFAQPRKTVPPVVGRRGGPIASPGGNGTRPQAPTPRRGSITAKPGWTNRPRPKPSGLASGKVIGSRMAAAKNGPVDQREQLRRRAEERRRFMERKASQLRSLENDPNAVHLRPGGFLEGLNMTGVPGVIRGTRSH